MTKIIAVSNQKGGVGKTTTTLNLATGLGMEGKKVLLVDLDPQGNATTGSGVEKNEVEATIYEVIMGEADINTVIHASKHHDVIPANQHLAAAELELVSKEQRVNGLKNQLQQLQKSYDFILLDCPPSLGLLTLNALTAAKSVIIPMQCEYFALEGLTDLVNTIKRVKQKMNPDIEIEGLLRTIYDSRNTLSKEVSDQLSSYFPNKVYKTIIPRNIRVAEAPSFGKSAIEHDKSSKGAKAYIDLAREIIHIEERRNG